MIPAPSIGVDANGTVHVAWPGKEEPYNPESDILYKQRNATTGTWSPAELVSTGSSGDSKGPSLAVDGDGDVHVIWSDYTPHYLGSGTDTDIFYRWRDALSGSWDPVELLSVDDFHSSLPRLGVDLGGNLHAMWVSLDATYYSYMDAVAGSWSVQVNVAPGAIGPTYQHFSVSPAGIPHITYMEWYNGSDQDRKHVYWNASGGTWTDPETIEVGERIACDGAGNLHAIEGGVYARWNAATATWSVAQQFKDFSEWPPGAIDADPDGYPHVVDGYSGTLYYMHGTPNVVPVVSHPADLTVPFNETNRSITWAITDTTMGYGSNWSVWDNDTLAGAGGFYSGAYASMLHEPADNVTVSLASIATTPGTHVYTLFVDDKYGGTASDEVVVTVLPAPPEPFVFPPWATILIITGIAVATGLGLLRIAMAKGIPRPRVRAATRSGRARQWLATRKPVQARTCPSCGKQVYSKYATGCPACGGPLDGTPSDARD